MGQLIQRCSALSLRAPELALVLGERAAALAEAAGADEQWIRAEGLVVSARVRLGDRAGMVGRAVAALRAAEHAGYTDVAARLRVDLAVCARSVGQPLTGLAALHPVLGDTSLPTALRAAALNHLVGCLAQFGRKAELDRVLAEADKLVLGDDGLAADTKLLVRALLRVGTSAHRRRHGDLTAAADAARTGLGFLEKLDNPADDGGLVRVRLTLQLVCTLLDRGDAEVALEIAQPVLAAPVRAGGVAPLGWLRLSVATRVHIPAGSGEAATMLVREAVADAESHGLTGLTSRLWLELAQIEERFGNLTEAMDCLHRSRAADHIQARVRRQACGLLGTEFGTAELAALDLDDVLKPARSAPKTPDHVSVPEPVRAEKPTPPPVPEKAAPRREPVAAREPRFEREEISAAREPRFEREEAVSYRAAAAAAREPRFEREEVVSYREPVVAPQPRFEPEEVVYREPVIAPEPRFEPVLADERRELPDVVLPELPMAPAPAAEPAPRVAPVAREVRVPEPAKPRWETDEERTRREPVVPVARTTRHDSEHGSVAARSVLDRLGISGGEGQAGGRRRAADEGPEPTPTRPDDVVETPRPPEVERRNGLGRSGHEDIDRERGFSPVDPPEPERTNGRRSRYADDRLDSERGHPWSASWAERTERLDFESDRTPSWSSGTGHGGRRRAEDTVRPEAVTPPPETPEKPEIALEAEPPWRRDPPLAPPPRDDPPVARNGYPDQVADPWLPRLRMPPSLDPLDDDMTWTPRSEPFGDNSYARAVAEDEPPPDAGLAELLARALAEHQAGTASAAALVKQLGPKRDRSDERRPVNGRGRGGDLDDNGRHRTGE